MMEWIPVFALAVLGTVASGCALLLWLGLSGRLPIYPVMMFGGGSRSAPPAPPPPSAPPQKSDTEIQDAAAKSRARLRLRKGRQATYLTSGPGVAGDAPLGGSGTVVERPTLLGGGTG